MKKVRLMLDDIRVDAFQVESPAATRRGTVVGQGLPTEWGWACPTRGEEPTCNLGSCNTGEPCGYCP